MGIGLKQITFDNVVTVAKDGSADFSTIDAAIGAAVSGDTVLVMPGTYNEPLTWKDGVTVLALGGAGTVTVTQTRTTAGQILTVGTGEMSFQNIDFTMTWNGTTAVDVDAITASGTGTINLRGCRVETFEGTATSGSMRAIRQTAGTVNILEGSKLIVNDASNVTTTPRAFELSTTGNVLVDNSTIEAGTNVTIGWRARGATANVKLHASRFIGTCQNVSLLTLEISGGNRFEGKFDGGSARDAFGPDMKVFTFNLPLPTASEDFTLGRLFGGPKEVVGVTATIRGGTSVTCVIRFGTDRSAGGTMLFTSVAISNKTTGQSVTTSNEAIPDGAIFWIETTALSGVVEDLEFDISYVSRVA